MMSRQRGGGEGASQNVTISDKVEGGGVQPMWHHTFFTFYFQAIGLFFLLFLLFRA